MDFDPRWSDDPRERDDRGRELNQGSRGGLSNPREREPLDARDVFTRDLELPRGPEYQRTSVRIGSFSGDASCPHAAFCRPCTAPSKCAGTTIRIVQAGSRWSSGA
jgi:hypothetical protein